MSVTLPTPENNSGTNDWSDVYSNDAALAVALEETQIELAEVKAIAEGLTPACKVTRTTNLGLELETVATVQWDAEVYDTDSMHSTSSNKDRLIAPRDGLYLVSGQLVFTAGDGIAAALITRSGSSRVGRATAERVNTAASTSEKVATFSFPLEMKATAYVSVAAYTKGAAAEVVGPETASVAPPSEFALTFLGPYPGP